MTIVKLLSCIGTVVSVALSVLPFFYQVYTGTFERTVELYGVLAKLVGLINSIIWFMYAIVTSKSDLSLGLLLMHAFVCMSNFTYLMAICGYKRATREGYILGAIFIGCISIISILVYFDVIPHVIVSIFGWLGMISLAFSHYIQIRDIVVSSEFGFILNVLEILLLVIIAIVGYLFPRAENANADDEAQLQNDHMSVALHMNSDTRGMIPLEDEQGIPETEDSIVVPQVSQLDASHLILQVRNVFEIRFVRSMVNPNTQTRVILLVEAITRTMVQIERDLYIPILLQASGIDGSSTNFPTSSSIGLGLDSSCMWYR
uniref:Bidirectional sugar transporter SWEET n=1 Tax=Oryza punctata TaxID=4537 RepID=A0A0E0JEM9_ORYPU